MDRDEAIKLLRGGADGIAEWNRRLAESGETPNLNNADLSGADLGGANLSGANLDYANLTEARLYATDLSRANLSRANLSRANLGEANLDRALLDDSDLSVARLNFANLSGANLNYANLSGGQLLGANLGEAKLIRANLSSTNLRDASLREANLQEADLRDAQLLDADLSGANLSRANLGKANLNRANLTCANFRRAISNQTVWVSIDLSEAIELATIFHGGPSVIGVETIIKSGGKIPQSFLEGCGVPDNWITYLPSLLGKPIDFYSCFISYGHQNEDFTRRLHSRMREDHFRVWYAPEDIKGGRKIHEQIDSAIKLHDKLLVVLSKQSMKSEWVKTEIWHARQREVKEGKRVLFPIRLVSMEAIKKWKAFDEETGKDMAREIRSYFIPDFTKWKDHDAFETSYQRLMKDFKPSPDDG